MTWLHMEDKGPFYYYLNPAHPHVSSFMKRLLLSPKKYIFRGILCAKVHFMFSNKPDDKRLSFFCTCMVCTRCATAAAQPPIPFDLAG